MRIESVMLGCGSLGKIEEHYGELLGLEIENLVDGCAVKIGASRLVFKESPAAYPFHLAFMIPTGKLNEARIWLKSRVNILSNEAWEIFNFSDAWNSSSIYWFDSEGNILELIEHRNLNNQTSGNFSSDDFLQICEVGINPIDVLDAKSKLETNFGIETFIFGNDRFHPVGTEEGLFILSKSGRTWFLTDIEGKPQEMRIEVSGVRPGHLVIDDLIEIRAK